MRLIASITLALMLAGCGKSYVPIAIALPKRELAKECKWGVPKTYPLPATKREIARLWGVNQDAFRRLSYRYRICAKWAAQQAAHT